MQVARLNMPKDSPCVGVDLAPIRPVTKCVAIQEDITTQKCRSSIKRELRGAKVDVVLHDGAPNVGTAWLQDAFGQNELTLHALRLAVDFLQPGGWFITKAFRSNDYNSLLFVFNQLFSRVEATKPSASRHESAEIFVVCKGFKAVTIDPKFLDPKHVFKDIDLDPKPVNVLTDKKGKKARPEGYDTTSQLIRSEVSVVDFVLGTTPVKMLGEVNVLKWDDSAECQLWRSNDLTKPEIYRSCADLKVLGKREFRLLLAWRLKMADQWKKANKGNEPEAADDEAGSSEDEDAKQDADISELQKLQKQRLKGAKRRAAEKRAKMRERLSMQMEHPGDRLDVAEELELFSLKKIRSASGLAAIVDDATPDEVAEDSGDENAQPQDEDDDDGLDYTDKLDAQLEEMYADYKSRQSRRAVALVREGQEDGPMSKKQRRAAREEAVQNPEETADEMARRVAAQQFQGVEDEVSSDDEDGVDARRPGARKGNPLLTRLDDRSGEQITSEGKTQASLWFGQDLFSGMLEEQVEDDEAAVAAMAEAARSKRRRGEAAAPTQEAGKSTKRPAAGKGESSTAPTSRGSAAATGAGDAAAAAPAAEAAAPPAKRKRQKELVPDTAKYVDVEPEGGERVVGGRHAQWDSEDEAGDDNEKGVQASIDRQAEAIVLGQLLLRPDNRRTLEESAYNRHTSNDTGLPQWFMDDERKFASASGYGMELPDDLLDKARDKLKDINARTIGKVAEAKGRKQRRLQRALTKVRKKANAVAAKEDLSEREKAREVEKLYKKRLAPKKESKTLIVGRKASAGPSGKKGHGIKMVDARLRKDARAEKRASSKKKSNSKAGSSGSSKEPRKGTRQRKAKQYSRR